MSEIETTLVRKRNELLRGLIDAHDKGERERLVEELKLADRLLAQLPKAEAVETRLGRHRRAIDAIWQVLSETGRTWKEAELINEVVRGGFLGGAPGSRLKVQKSIKIFLHGAGKDTALALKSEGDLVGMKQWPDEMFANEKPRP